MISIVIPAHNEHSNLRKLLEKPFLKAASDLEIIVALSPGNNDGSEQIPVSTAVQFLNCSGMGRAVQMNQAALKAKGDILVFLHADVLPPDSLVIDIERTLNESYDAGFFSYRFDRDTYYLKINALFTANDGFFTGGGDQCLFIRKSVFWELGGFDARQVIMEDFEFFDRMKKQKVPYKIIKNDLIVSARKYQNNSYLRINLSNLMLLSLYKLGYPATRLKSLHNKLIRTPYQKSIHPPKQEKTVNGIQQIGLGVKNAKKVFNWYRKNLGFDILVFEDESTADLMTRYTNGKIFERYALLALNLKGGGGLEVWQYKNREPKHPANPIELGDLGINIMKIRSVALDQTHRELKKQIVPMVGDSIRIDHETSSFFLSDPWNNLIQIVQDPHCYSETKSPTGGILGAVIGVSDMEKSISFYTGLFDYEVLKDRTGIFNDFIDLPGGKNRFRRVLLRNSAKKVGGFGELLGSSEIELLQVLDRTPLKIYKDRLWGDLGFIHLCFDIHGMDVFRQEASLINQGFTVDSAESFDMGEAAGRFSYVEDPDGTLIELVETHKVPIVKSLGIYINLKKRKQPRPLSRWLVRTLKVHRVHKDL